MGQAVRKGKDIPENSGTDGHGRSVWETVPFTQANDGWDHLVTYRTDLPEPVFTAIYEGAPFTKSQTDQVKYAMGFADDWIVVPTRLADKGGDRVEFMKSEAEAHSQGFGKKIEETILYGNRATNPREFTGLATMFNDDSLDNVLDCAGTRQRPDQPLAGGVRGKDLLRHFPRGG